MRWKSSTDRLCGWYCCCCWSKHLCHLPSWTRLQTDWSSCCPAMPFGTCLPHSCVSSCSSSDWLLLSRWSFGNEHRRPTTLRLWLHLRLNGCNRTTCSAMRSRHLRGRLIVDLWCHCGWLLHSTSRYLTDNLPCRLLLSSVRAILASSVPKRNVWCRTRTHFGSCMHCMHRRKDL